MSGEWTRYTAEETARRGDELYEGEIRARVEAGNHGKVMAIDIETGAYAVADTAVAAAHSVRSQHPGAEVWFVRVGHPALHRLGGLPKLKS
jgi:hypothetical protein